MSIEKTIQNIFLSIMVSTNIIIYFFSEIKTVGGYAFLTKIIISFYNNAQFCIFVHITNSSFCNVFVKNTAFVTFQSSTGQAKTHVHYYWI